MERLHNSSRRFVPILDPGIPVLPGYTPYDEGIERDIFIRDVTGQPYIGEVRPYGQPWQASRSCRLSFTPHDALCGHLVTWGRRSWCCQQATEAVLEQTVPPKIAVSHWVVLLVF